MKFASLLPLFLLLSASYAQAQKAIGCSSATDNDETIWGHIATELESDPVAKVTGKVLDMNEAPIYLALVEVFVDDGNGTPTSPKTKRLVGCITDHKGKYHFRGLKKGNYILAVGARGFNITFVRFKFDPDNQKSRKKLDVMLQAGT